MSSGDEEPPAASLVRDRLRAERWPDVPTTVLAGRDDRFFPYEFQRRLAKSGSAWKPNSCPAAICLPSASLRRWSPGCYAIFSALEGY